jgi:hypothetical protein
MAKFDSAEAAELAHEATPSMVPALPITSEIRNSYIYSLPSVNTTILVLLLAAYSHFLASFLSLPYTTMVRTILQAVRQHWSGLSGELDRRSTSRCRIKNKDPTIPFH